MDNSNRSVVKFSRAHCLVSGKLGSDHVITARQNRIKLRRKICSRCSRDFRCSFRFWDIL